MAGMPKGEPRTVPDPAGERYDQAMARVRARRRAEDQGGASPLRAAGQFIRDFQDGPDIPRPSLAQSFIPVVGPAWEAAGDFQDGDYGGAAGNVVAAGLDLLPIGVAAKGLRAASKGIKILKEGSVTADAARKAMRRAGVAKPGQEIHHTIPLNGTGRNAQDPRNHFALLKALPKDKHRRLTGSWEGKPKFGPVGQVWYGTTDWMKAVPAGLVGRGADSIENLTRDRGPKR